MPASFIAAEGRVFDPHGMSIVSRLKAPVPYTFPAGIENITPCVFSLRQRGATTEKIEHCPYLDPPFGWFYRQKRQTRCLNFQVGQMKVSWL